MFSSLYVNLFSWLNQSTLALQAQTDSHLKLLRTPYDVLKTNRKIENATPFEVFDESVGHASFTALILVKNALVPPKGARLFPVCRAAGSTSRHTTRGHPLASISHARREKCDASIYRAVGHLHGDAAATRGENFYKLNVWVGATAGGQHKRR